jgi:hypothetical protein
VARCSAILCKCSNTSMRFTLTYGDQAQAAFRIIMIFHSPS